MEAVGLHGPNHELTIPEYLIFTRVCGVFLRVNSLIYVLYITYLYIIQSSMII